MRGRICKDVCTVHPYTQRAKPGFKLTNLVHISGAKLGKKTTLFSFSLFLLVIRLRPPMVISSRVYWREWGQPSKKLPRGRSREREALSVEIYSKWKTTTQTQGSEIANYCLTVTLKCSGGILIRSFQSSWFFALIQYSICYWKQILHEIFKAAAGCNI